MWLACGQSVGLREDTVAVVTAPPLVLLSGTNSVYVTRTLAGSSSFTCVTSFTPPLSFWCFIALSSSPFFCFCLFFLLFLPLHSSFLLYHLLSPHRFLHLHLSTHKNHHHHHQNIDHHICTRIITITIPSPSPSYLY